MHHISRSCKAVAIATIFVTAGAFFASRRAVALSSGGEKVPPPATYSFGPSGINGAGFQNGVALHPSDPNIVLSAADVSGIYVSRNGGDSWNPANKNVTDDRRLKVAAVTFARKNTNKAYAAVGTRAGGGGFLVSDDKGGAWKLVSTVPQFTGNNPRGDGGLPSEHPRSTGNLIALDEANGFVYVATYKDGVMRSKDDGATWDKLGLAGKFLRSIAIDPNNADTIYTAAYDNHVWKTTTARGAGKFEQLASSPPIVEELIVVGTSIYAAASADGIFKSDDAGKTWSHPGGDGIDNAGPTWLSIDGYVDQKTGKHVIYAGNLQARRGEVSRNGSLMRSTDGGATWVSLTKNPSKVHRTMNDPGGEAWWLLDKRPEVAIGNKNFVAAQIAVDRSNPKRIFVAGRSGLWRSMDGGENWYPIVNGLMVTFNRNLLADPTRAGRVYVSNTDWVLMYSTDSMRHMRHNPPPNPNRDYNMGISIALDKDGALYIGGGDRDDNEGGEVYSNLDPSTVDSARNKWTSEGLKAATGGSRPIAVAVGRAGEERVLLAAVKGDEAADGKGGVWRKAGSGKWQRMDTPAMTGVQRTNNAAFAWAADSAIVYLYDRQTGIWRSSDYGKTWGNIWQHPSPEEQTGYLAVNSDDPKQLYISARDGLYRADDAGTAERITPKKIADVLEPGPLTYANGVLYVTGRVGEGRGINLPRLYRTVQPWTAGSPSWTDVADDYYKSVAGFPYSVAADKDGTLYVALSGNGAIVGKPQR